MAGKAFTSSHVHNDPIIYSGRAVKRTKAAPVGVSTKKDHAVALPLEVTEQKGDLLIRDLWQQGTDSVHDMRVVNTNTQLHRPKDPDTCLREAEREKKRMYLEACLQQRRHFCLFADLVDGLMGVEATATLKTSSSRLATMWKKS